MALKWTPATVETRFHIDTEWFQEEQRDMRVLLRDMLCEGCTESYADYRHAEAVDWVDEETGEVSRVDALWHSLRECCSTRPDFVTPATPIVDAVFRTLLANGNKPMSVLELHQRIDRRPPEVLLRLLTAGETHMGIRPVYD